MPVALRENHINMEKKVIKKRIFALLLTMVMALSMTLGGMFEAFAEDEVSAAAAETEAEANEAGEEADSIEEATRDEAEPEYGSGSDEQAAEEAATDDDEAETPETSEQAVTELTAQGTDVGGLTATATQRINGNVEIKWDNVDGASYYKVYAPEYDSVAAQTVKTGATLLCTFKGLEKNTVYTFKVEAYAAAAGSSDTDTDTVADDAAASGADAGDELLAEGEVTITTYKSVFDESSFRTLGSKSVGASSLGLSLRTMLGEGNGGYAVAQGAATDGKYAYYILASSSTQNGRVLKVNLSNRADYAKGPVINLHHANGMTYDSKRGLLVCVGYGAWRNQITYVNPNTLTIDSQPTLKYSYVSKMSGVPDNAENNGIAAISYIPEYDVYVARSRGKVSGYSNTTSSASNNIWVFNAQTLEAIGHIYTKVNSDYPETYQAMDADEKYVYYLLSPGSGQSKNIILCLDWNSENILPVVNGEKDYVESMWSCNNNNNGKIDAKITLPITHESEGIFHTTDASGREHFYVSEYYGRWKYKTVTKKVKYKKKWKKVRKWYNKKTKKWTKKKPKKKYRGKSKKVWKYKTKTKKVKKKVKDYWARDDYVYDIGVI